MPLACRIDGSDSPSGLRSAHHNRSPRRLSTLSFDSLVLRLTCYLCFESRTDSEVVSASSLAAVSEEDEAESFFRYVRRPALRVIVCAALLSVPNTPPASYSQRGMGDAYESPDAHWIQGNEAENEHRGMSLSVSASIHVRSQRLLLFTRLAPSSLLSLCTECYITSPHGTCISTSGTLSDLWPMLARSTALPRYRTAADEKGESMAHPPASLLGRGLGARG
ncbi:hypothetical protein MVEN_00136000 [Mycena venus]|uniref:Uncharacterized protein n=1 Tax=Mycena venus TaxID=2733690 RepID=A0A8H7DBB8_9AGAR|nr:hypothetical protein MVEN_00136000 [Mycena venus]